MATMLRRDLILERRHAATGIVGLGALAILLLGAPTARAQGGGTDTSSIEPRRPAPARRWRLDTEAARDSVAARNEERRAELMARFRTVQRRFDRERLSSGERVRLGSEMSSLIQSLMVLDAQHLATNLQLGLAPEAPGGGLTAVPGMDWSTRLEMLRAPQRALPRGWIGINVEAPHVPWVRADSLFIRYFDYPQIVSIEPNSPAARAGIAPGDVLVAYDGADVRDRTINVSRLLVPTRRVMVTVSRDGDRRDFPLVVAHVPTHVALRRAETNQAMAPTPPPSPEPPRTFIFGGLDAARAPIAGASLEGIDNPDLGRIFGVSSGVLVTDVLPGQAREAGLRGGDVIVRADRREVRSVPQLRSIMESRADDRAVELEIVRHRRRQRLILRW